jgi:hypothetical protein
MVIHQTKEIALHLLDMCHPLPVFFLEIEQRLL